MLTTSRVLAELLEGYIASVSRSAGDYRIIVPGLTPRLGEELHGQLMSQSVNSFLVINVLRGPDEARRWLSPVSLTTMRVGSFVAVTDPGALADIRDSIRGSGGAVRSSAFSEEWPWIDNGNETFRFRGPFLSTLLSKWTTDAQVRGWLFLLVGDVLIEATWRAEDRAVLLLEDILGSFDAAKPDSLPTIQERFLFHCGIPKPPDADKDPARIARDTRSLVKSIIDRVRTENDVRGQVLGNIEVDDPDADALKDAVETFFDGLADPSSLDGDVLAFRGCWGKGDDRLRNWLLLTADRLRKLFEVQGQPPIELACHIVPEGGVLVSEDQHSAACRSSTAVRIAAHYEIPSQEFAGASCVIRLGIRSRIVEEQVLPSATGDRALTVSIEALGVSYRTRVPLKVSVLVNGAVRGECRLSLHCCGKQRPAFAVVTPPFWVDDAAVVSEDDPAPEHRYLVDGPVVIHLLADEETQPEVKRDDGRLEQLVQQDGVWATANALDVFGEPSGRISCRCQVGTRWVSLTFEAEDIERGEFTLEDELRQLLVSSRVERVRDVLSIHAGTRKEPYPHLGGITEESRRRIRIARCFEDRSGWRVVLADLLCPVDGMDQACGDFARIIGRAEAGAIAQAALPTEALKLLEAYAEKRDAFRQLILNTLHATGSIREHPDYAVYPFYLSDECGQRPAVEKALLEYLAAYRGIQCYLEAKPALSWAQEFILLHLDCVVHWADDESKYSVFLIGPWHPMVAAKRFMVQRALVLRAGRLVSDGDRSFCRLIGMLSQVPGFHWYPALKASDVSLEPAYVTPTSDPGWHLAFKERAPESLAGTPSTGVLGQALRSLRDNFGMEARIYLPAAGGMLDTVLNSYIRTFPSKRHLGVYFPLGFRGEEEVASVDRFLHADEEGPTEAGLQLSGGVNLCFSAPPHLPDEVVWSSPDLKVFRYENREECVAEQHPDVQFCRAEDGMGFLETQALQSVPRGSDYGVVFSQSLLRLTEGQAAIPQSVGEEWDRKEGEQDSLKGLFTDTCFRAGILSGRSHGIIRSTSLPIKLETTWTVVPGAVLDPAIFVRYVKDGIDRRVEERVLWDYHVSLTGGSTSFFVLSTIPAAFRGAINGIFGQGQDLAAEFVTELGQIGVAIAGEAMKSGRHALGTVGIVGAVRLLYGDATRSGPLHWCDEHVGFLLPVDSFRDVLEGGGGLSSRRRGEEPHRRADLLAVVLRLPRNLDEPLVIQALAIECKFTSSTFPDANVQPALEQARATAKQLQKLCTLARQDSGMPERLALIQLVQFGLRITGSHEQNDSAERLRRESIVYEHLLQGRFEYRPPTADSVLVSTEFSLRGAAEMTSLQSGVWIRLNRDNWPGVAETSSIVAIRKAVGALFNLPEEPPAGGTRGAVIVNPSPPTGPATEPRRELGAQPEERVSEETRTPEAEREPTGPVPSTEGDQERTPAEASGIVLRKILVGMDTSRRAVYFDPHSPVDRLDNANMMITGSSGKGKTQLLKYLMASIREQGANTLVLDFKNDFASDSHFVREAGLSPIIVFFDGMPFNPLIPYPVVDPRTGVSFVQCAQHIAGVAAVFRRTYGLGAQQEAALKNAIRQAFTESGVNPSGTTQYDPAVAFPDLARVGEILEQTNALAYNRLDPLFTLGLFREEYWRSSFATMVNRSAAIDFSQIPSDPLKNALAELVILSAHSFFNSQAHCGKLRQVFVVDEAHRILKADYLEKFALECRAYGVSLLLSSQYPSHFPPEISACMATKIIHGNDRDVDRVREIVNLLGCPGREAEVADLAMFEALFSNKHFRNVLLRTITYPLHLVLSALRDSGELSRDQIAEIDGIDPQKLSVGNIVRHLERLGLCETVDERVRLISRETR